MQQKTDASRYILKNVLLETGFSYEDGEVVKTNTGLFCITIENGRIFSVQPNNPDADAIDAKGMLLLPALKDMHSHLDKMLFGLPWKAVSGKNRTVKDMIALEQQIIPELLKTSVARTEQLIEMLQSYGISFARSHFNIDPTSGLKSLEHLQEALLHKEDSFEAELVAFPQHGIFYTDTASLMKEVAQMDNVQFIGGLDPYTIDGSIEKPMDFITQLALDNNKGIDIHLHERGTSGIKTIEYLINKALENPQLQGKTFISHAFALGHLSERETGRMAERLAEARVGICTSVPIGGTVMPIPTLMSRGVEVLVGNDNIQDHWGTLGSGNMLEKANRIAELYGYETEFELSRMLGFATKNMLPLDDNGNQQWPKAGDAADVILVDASCSAEAVARRAPVRSLICKGKVVF